MFLKILQTSQENTCVGVSLSNKVAGLRSWKFIQNRSSRLQMFFKIGVFKNFGNSRGKHLCWSLFLTKFLTNFIKDTPTQVFSCEICEIFKNTFSYRTPLVTASEWTLLSSRLRNNKNFCWFLACFKDIFDSCILFPEKVDERKLGAAVQRCSIKKLFVEISQNSQENTCARASFLLKLQARPATLLKKRRWCRCFPVDFVKFRTKPFYTERFWWLLLESTIFLALMQFNSFFRHTGTPEPGTLLGP